MNRHTYRAGLSWWGPGGGGHLSVVMDLSPRHSMGQVRGRDAVVEPCRICGSSDVEGQACQVCGGPLVHVVNVETFLLRYRDGDERGWEAEFDWLRSHHADRLAQLRAAVAAEGRIVEPVQVGPDGRVWDGHHRVMVAHDLGLPVPVVVVEQRP